jgi:hypothetical protein
MPLLRWKRPHHIAGLNKIENRGVRRSVRKHPIGKGTQLRS